MPKLSKCSRCDGTGYTHSLAPVDHDLAQLKCRYCGGIGIGPVSIQQVCELLLDIDKRLEMVEKKVATLHERVDG